MDGTPWLLLDTKTTGPKTPLYVVELAAQRMRGWVPEGEPFFRALNHGIDITPEVSRVCGYTRAILERDGDPPLAVYGAFGDYVDDRPLVSYHLSYDLDDVLRPEWQRLARDPIGRPGFCALRLTQRLLDPVPAGNHKLQTLREYYRLPARGAHTALSDVETVVDLLQQVLRPLAEAAGLTTWEELCDFTAAPWFPSRIAFGQFKGRPFREALDDPDLHAWLQWLAGSSNARSAEMGRWYLAQLRLTTASRPSPVAVLAAALSDSGKLVLYRDPELDTLRRLIAGTRARLADLEAEYTREHHAVAVVRAQLFTLLQPHYARRDTLRLEVQYRRRYLDRLLVEGEEDAEAVAQEHEQARANTEREYTEAAAQAAGQQALSPEEEQELKEIYRKLARLYHPDRYAHDPEKQAIYERLMQEINKARDEGDIGRLREIAQDPNGFLLGQGLGYLDFADDAELTKLRQLYDTLQARLLDAIEALERLRESGDYELYRLSRERPEAVQELADRLAEEISTEVAALEDETVQLAAEIEALTGSADPFSR
ncbi:exonuclease domain-containing protein [Methylolobus aquaticus]